MRTLAKRSERTIADIFDFIAPGPGRRTQVDEVEAYRTLRRVASRRAAPSRNGETDSVTSRQSPFRAAFTPVRSIDFYLKDGPRRLSTGTGHVRSRRYSVGSIDGVRLHVQHFW